MAACAVGSEEGTSVDDLTPAVDSTDGGSNGNEAREASAPTDTVPAPHVDAGQTILKDAGSDSGSIADSAVDSGGVSCVSPNTCFGATDTGTVSGDTGADVHTASGTTSMWFKVRVTENDNSGFGRPLNLRAELVSPPGSNFDLYLYVNQGTDVVECSTATTLSTNPAGQMDTAALKLGETGLLANGNPDDRTVSVEVRDASGTCSAASSWTLTLKGN